MLIFSDVCKFVTSEEIKLAIGTCFSKLSSLSQHDFHLYINVKIGGITFKNVFKFSRNI